MIQQFLNKLKRLHIMNLNLRKKIGLNFYPMLLLWLAIASTSFSSIGQNCPDYSSTVTSDANACGGQNYYMRVENTGCNGVIYITIQTNYENGWGFNWVLESVLTGNTIASGTNGNETVTIGPVNPNTQGNTFDLILNDPNGWGFLSYEYIEARQGANVLAHLNDPGHSMFVADIEISSATMTVSLPGGGTVSKQVEKCKNVIIPVPLNNNNLCTSVNVNLPWQIRCDVTNDLLASGTHTVTIHPEVPSAASDIVDISWNSSTCSWDISPKSDCDLFDLG